MKITIDMVLAENPCPRYTRETLETLAAGRESLTPSEVVNLPISLDDKLWVLSRFVGRRDPTRIMARRVARDALGDREIPDEYRVWLDSGDEKLMDSAWDAAWAVDRTAAWAAARCAAGAVDGDAAWFAARAAASAATRFAVRSAAMKKYLGWMVEYLENTESEEL